jgi:hypothetical protein
MIPAKATKPRVYPRNSARSPEQIDRAQDIGGDLSLNREKLYEIGRDGILGYRKQTPSFSYSMTQYEYGSMDFWRALANQVDPASAGEDNSVTLEDLKTPFSDITAYLTDDSGTFVGSIWFPKLRVNGFGLNIGDPDAIAERTFDLVGEDYKILNGAYFAYETATVGAPGDGEVTLSPIPVQYEAGKYILAVLRVRSGVVSELEEDSSSPYADNTWRYDNGTYKVTVQDCLLGDILKVYYASATAYETLWTDNDSDSDALSADSCEIFMKVGTSQKLYRLQSVGIDVALDRTDYKEIGNSEIVQTGVTGKTVTVTLGRLLEDFTIEEVLAGDPAYPMLNPRDFSDSVQLMVKIYSDRTKTQFKIGYLISDLSPTALSSTRAVEEYNNANNTLESDNIMVSDDVNEIVFA